MKIGFFADIHGNIYAFEKTWKALQKESCDVYLFLGDICGYYYHQNEIIEVLRLARNLVAVRGNHDDIFLNALTDETIEKEYTYTYGRSIELLKKNIKRENLQFIKELPKMQALEDLKMALFHGSPLDYLNGYVYPQDSLDGFASLPYSYVFLGHTHYPLDKNAGNVRVVNPGSCGQPRDSNQPSYAILDSDSGKVCFKRITYNTQPLIKDVLGYAESNKYLTEVLKRRKPNG